ncbi:hypothetical protein BH11MYX4_BH11MYX4_06470 [soil metagenome]
MAKTRIVVRTAGRKSNEHLDVGDGEHVLIGRSPDWDRIDSPPEAKTQTLAIASPSVSANHVHLRREGDRIHIVDLGSRNGTWVGVPPRGEVSARIAIDPLEIHLSSFSPEGHPAEAPSDAQWAGRSDYGNAVGAALQAWLDTKEIPSRIHHVATNDDMGDEVGRLPLATGQDLVIEPTRTTGPSWLVTLAQAERWVARQNALFDMEESMRAEGLVVASPAMRGAVSRVVAAAAGGARVLLITGPSGSGKEGLANLFHRRLGRAGPFVARNCAMFSKELVRSELFGAEKGAFTGSVQRIVGAVEMANEGTLFLDELGELPREVQPMLLRFLDHGEYERLGSYGRAMRADVRIVAATNRDLRAASLKNEFRTDLWFRLSVHVVEVPALRDRPEDITAYLASREIAKGRSLLDALAPGTLEVLEKHEWEGNFRELVNFAERSIAAAARAPITPEAAIVALREGSLQPLRGSPVRSELPPADDFLTLVQRARDAFEEDHAGESPRTWDQIKDLVENYLKPVLFAELSEASKSGTIEGVELRTAAERLRADRGTAVKQLRRYFDRFGS